MRNCQCCVPVGTNDDCTRACTFCRHLRNLACDHQSARGSAHISKVVGSSRRTNSSSGGIQVVPLRYGPVFLFSGFRVTADANFWCSSQHVRIAGGIILMKIGFELFSSSPSGKNDRLGANGAPRLKSTTGTTARPHQQQVSCAAARTRTVPSLTSGTALLRLQRCPQLSQL